MKHQQLARSKVLQPGFRPYRLQGLSEDPPTPEYEMFMPDDKICQKLNLLHT